MANFFSLVANGFESDFEFNRLFGIKVFWVFACLSVLMVILYLQDYFMKKGK